MAYRERQKISQMTPKGADLEATDLIEVSTIESGSYVTRSITGQELIDSIPVTSGTVTSVDVTMPSAFSVSGSPITTSGTIAITGAGTTSQLIDGTGALQTIPTGLPPTGTAGGDLSGTYPNPNVTKIHGVDMQSGTPTSGDTWVYGGSPAKWQHQMLHASQVDNDSAVTGTHVDAALNTLNTNKVNTSRNITINGTTQDLSADRTYTVTDANLSTSDITTNDVSITKHGFVPKAPNDTTKFLRGDGTWATAGGGLTIGTTAITSGTVGRILFEGTGNVLQEDSALFWDNTNKRLGVGATPSTSVRLDVRAQGALSTDIAFRVRNSADTANIVAINGDGSQNWILPNNNVSTVISSGPNTLLQWGNTNFENIALGLGATITPTTAYNTLVGSGATISATTSNGIGLGWRSNINGNSSIGIGSSVRVLGTATIKIGAHTGASSFGGTNSIHIGRTTSGNDVTPDDVFMTYFNDQSSSTLTRGNGSFGLLGKQAYILGNGSGTYGTDTFMGNGGNTFVVRSHPNVPSTNIIDSFQQYSADITAGNAAPHFRTENGNIIKLYRETTGVAAAAFVANTSGIANDTATFGGYTIGQVVAALKNLGILA